MTTKSLRAGVGALIATVFAAATVALAGPSGALPGVVNFLPVDFEVFQPGQLQMAAALTTSCDDPITTDQITFTFQGTPTTAVTATVDGTDGAFLVTVPATLATVTGTPNLVEVSVTCDIDSQPVTQTGTFGWAQINVTKVVVGDAPADGLYAINVDCGSVVNSVNSAGPAQVAPTTTFDATLKAGETFSLFALTNGTCAITETNSQGAETAVVSPSSVTIAASELYPVTITNTFPVIPPAFTG